MRETNVRALPDGFDAVRSSATSLTAGREGGRRVGFLRFVGGVGLATISLGPLIGGAVAVRARWFPSVAAATARVAISVMVIAAVTVIAEVLGVLGILGLWQFVGLAAAAGSVGWWWVRSLSTGNAVAPTPADRAVGHRPHRATLVVAGLGVAIVSVQWLSISFEGLRDGMQSRVVDTFWYHGPTAARFVQEGSITAVQYFDADPVTAYFPGGSSLLHAVGILLFGNDVMSPILNLAFFALALAAGWAIGAAAGLGPHAMLAVAAVLGTPMLVETQPGGMYNDVIGLAFVLAAVALLVGSERRGPLVGIAALAAGLALGVKLTMLPTVGLVTLVVITLAPRGRRIATASMWSGLMALVGGVWYVRNWVVAGNPLPGLSFTLGPISLPHLPTSTPTDSVVNYLTDPNILDTLYRPGLDHALGPAWWAIILLSIAGGLYVACRGRVAQWRIAGGIAFVAFLAYLVQPQYLGVPGLPLFFSVNVRYATAAFTLGLLSLCGLRSVEGSRGRHVLLGALVAVIAVTQFDVHRLWLAPLRDVAVALVASGATVSLTWVLVDLERRTRLAIGVAVAVGVVLGGWWLQRGYLEHRYVDEFVNPPLVDVIRNQRDRRIAIEGFILQYALYGPDLSNTVDYLGRSGPDGAWRNFDTCRGFIRALDDGSYDYLVVTHNTYPQAVRSDARLSALRWAAAFEGHGLTAIARDGDAAVTYRTTAGLDPSRCVHA